MALVRAALAGDRAALEQLLGPHRRSVVAICYGILGNPEDAEDAAQETFLRALRGLSTFWRDAAFRSWLIRIALNIGFSWKRARRPASPASSRRALLLSAPRHFFVTIGGQP